MARRVRRPGPLDRRAQAILRAVIEEYVTDRDAGRQPGARRAVPPRPCPARPSATSSRSSSARACSAIPTPRPGASRPTSAIAGTSSRSSTASPLPEVEQLMIRHQFGQVEFASEHWFRLAASTLASRPTPPASRRRPSPPRPASAGSTSSRSTSRWRASSSCSARAPSSRSSSRSTTVEDQAALNVAATLNDASGGPHPARSRGRCRERWIRRCPTRLVVRVARADRARRCPSSTRAADRGGVQRRAAQRHGRARVRAEREAPAGVHGAREPGGISAGSSGSVAGRRGVTVFIGKENGRPTCARSRSCSRRTAAPIARSASSACSGLRAWPIRGDRHRRLRLGPHERARRPPVQLIGDQAA